MSTYSFSVFRLCETPTRGPKEWYGHQSLDSVLQRIVDDLQGKVFREVKYDELVKADPNLRPTSYLYAAKVMPEKLNEQTVVYLYRVRLDGKPLKGVERERAVMRLSMKALPALSPEKWEIKLRERQERLEAAKASLTTLNKALQGLVNQPATPSKTKNNELATAIVNADVFYATVGCLGCLSIAAGMLWVMWSLFKFLWSLL